ncbi:MAG: hypothetical protein ACFB0B_10905 [Thermonemataceae bacterium]
MQIMYFIFLVSLLFTTACGGGDDNDNDDNNNTNPQFDYFMQFTIGGVEYTYGDANFFQVSDRNETIILGADGESFIENEDLMVVNIGLPDRSLNTYTEESRGARIGLSDGEGGLDYGLRTIFTGGNNAEKFGNYTINVTAYNEAARTIEGTFSATLYKGENSNNLSAPDSIIVTNGRFVAVELDI